MPADRLQLFSSRFALRRSKHGGAAISSPGKQPIAAGRHSGAHARFVLCGGNPLFPFVAIRALGQEKETGALRLLVQLPYRPSTLVSAKLAAVLAAWILASIPALSALIFWRILGGHLAAVETANLLFGHLVYGLLVGALALFSASIAESAATAAIIALAVTIGSWVLDFTVAGNPGPLSWIAQLSLTQTLRPFEQGLLSGGLVLGAACVIFGLIALATFGCRPVFHHSANCVARCRGC